MKTKRRASKQTSKDKAEVGIGTMIVFIAAVIVAAIAAAVLVNVAGDLQRKSAETGQETTQEVSSNMFVRDIVGDVNTTSGDGLERIYWYISLAPGAEPVDLNETVIRWEHTSNLQDLPANSTDSLNEANCNTLSDGFCIVDVKDAGDGDAGFLDEGDRVKISVGLDASEEVGTREDVSVLFLPEAGSPVDASFTTPATYGQEEFVNLAS